MVFVLDKHKKPLMPCTPRRARLLLEQKRAVVHQLSPFIIRLKDREVATCTLQPVVLKVDPGSRITGMALVRVEGMPDAEVHHALHLAELAHRGEDVREALGKRATRRRRRRPALPATAFRQSTKAQGVVAPQPAQPHRQCADLGQTISAVGARLAH